MPRNQRTTLPQPLFHEPSFSEGTQTADPTGFKTTHPSDTATYKQVENLLKKDVVTFPKSRLPDDGLYTLEQAYGNHGADVIKKIKNAKKIIFHALGDSGASNSGKYPHELKVADQVTLDCAQSDEFNRPAFLFHIGDIVYNFGEAQYYYDQFYEPFRNYPAPIFAIPGNHDSFVVPGTPKNKTPLTTFMRNFCADKPTITAEAGPLHRTAGTQPGVYFTLAAPFVRIIGMFSNSLEDPGVISSQTEKNKKKWPSVPDYQLAFLRAQLRLLKQDKFAGAVLLATHHPPFSYSPPAKHGGAGGNHGNSAAMLRQIDTICKQEGVYPHAFLSAHAHNMQRYTRIVEFNGKDYDVPFIVCGDGGHNVNSLVRPRKGERAVEPHPGTNVDYLENNPALKTKELILEKYDDRNYGYLRIHVDKDFLKIGFHQVGVNTLAQSRFDMVTVQLSDHTMVAN